MALLGQSINPALFLQDYSGFAKAGAIQAQGMQNLGQQIQQAAGDYAANKKEESKLNAIAKAGKTQLESALNLYGDKIPGLREKLAPTIAAFSDPNRSAVEKAAIAQVSGDELNNYLNFSLKQQELGVNERARSTASLISSAKMQETARHNLAMETKGGEQSFKIVPTRVDVEGNTYELPVLFDPKSGDRYDPDTKAKIGDMAKYASGQSGWEAQAEKPQDTSTSFNADALSENLKELAPNFISAGRKYNVSPTLLASIAEHETGGGTSNAFLNKNNVMGVSNQEGPISFGNRVESIDRMAKLIGEGINENKGPYAGAKTIQDLGSIYAPVGAENDQRGLNSGWASGVSAGIDKLSQPSQQVSSQPSATADLISQAAGQAKVREGAVRIQPPKGFRLTTPEEAIKFGGPGQIDIAENRFYPLAPASGTEVKVNPTTGEITFTQGAGVGQTKAEAARAVQKQQNEDRTKAFIDTTSGMMDRVEKLKSGIIPSMYRKLSATASEASESGKLESDLSRLRTSISFKTMNEMRAASPTGGAAGNMTVAEWPRFEDLFGKLAIGGDPTQLANRLKEASLTLFNGVHGSPEQRSQWLAEGKITPEENKKTDEMYMDMRNRIKIPKAGIPNVSGSALPSDAVETKLSPEAQQIRKELGL